mgnify:CR=1 FL=1
MKKLIFIIISLLILSGCNANYSLSYKDGKFTEEINIEDFYDDQNNEGEPHISYYENEPVYYDINNTDVYKVEIKKRFNGNYDLKFIANYNKISYSNSIILNQCIEYFKYEENDKTIYITAYGKYTCYGFEGLSIDFSSDKKISYSNAQKIKNNKHYWEYEYGDYIDIELEINKNEEVLFPLYYLKYIFYIIAFSIIIYVILKFYKLSKANKEI